MLTTDADHDTAPRSERVADGEVARTGEIRFDVSRDEYDEIEAMNWSRLKIMMKSPRHFQHALLSKYVDTDAKQRGRAVHLAVLEPARFQAECVVWEGGARRGAEWEKFSKKNAHREILTERTYEEVKALAGAVRASSDAMRWLSNGRSEATITWRASAPGTEGLPGWDMALKSRLDFVGGAALADLKTTRDASPRGFQSESWRYRYDAQAAFYSDAHEAATGRRLPYYLIAVETEPPHVVTSYLVPEEILALGRKSYRECLERLAFCLRENVWPAYGDGDQILTLPQWAAPSNDDDVAELDLIINNDAGGK